MNFGDKILIVYTSMKSLKSGRVLQHCSLDARFSLMWFYYLDV